MSVGDAPVFFKYTLENIDEWETDLVLLNLSNRSKLQVYVGSSPFPDETKHEYPLGDVPRKVLKALFKNSLKMEIFEDSSPYVYDQESDQVVYRQDYDHLNPLAILPEAECWLDGLKIAQATTWTPESGPEVEASDFDRSKLQDRIDFIFWGKSETYV